MVKCCPGFAGHQAGTTRVAQVFHIDVDKPLPIARDGNHFHHWPDIVLTRYGKKARISSIHTQFETHKQMNTLYLITSDKLLLCGLTWSKQKEQS